MSSNCNIYKKNRAITADSFLVVLKELLKTNEPISEIDLRDKWREELRKHKQFFPDGWYTPPPHGISIIFSTDENFQRTNFKSFRWEKYWPSTSSFLDTSKGFIVAYASPVDRKTGIIGDFGLTLYFGKNEKIKKHLKNILDSQKDIFSYAKIGMSFSEIYLYAEKLFGKMKLSNDWWINVTDTSGRNIGHTIPAALERWNIQEEKILKNAETNWQEKANIISNKRIFVSPKGNYIVTPGAAFTIEHRLKSTENLPVIWFHTATLFHENGEKEFLTNFDEIFTLASMDYMLQ